MADTDWPADSDEVAAMSRSNRMFEIIQLLRRADGPLTAAALADTLEVTPRTVYRDIAALQAMRVPIDGAAGIGYLMRPGYDLPPLMFTVDEVEAIVVGLALLRRTGDAGLLDAAGRAGDKIAAVLPDEFDYDDDRERLYVSGWHRIPAARADLQDLRRAIRVEEKLHLTYGNAAGDVTVRTVKPLAVLYYIDAVVLAAWCELRADFRHFRIDRIADCVVTGEHFRGQGDALRRDWQQEHGRL